MIYLKTSRVYLKKRLRSAKMSMHTRTHQTMAN